MGVPRDGSDALRIAVRSDEARAVAGRGEAESGPAPSQRI